jgi:hypothetical protein
MKNIILIFILVLFILLVSISMFIFISYRQKKAVYIDQTNVSSESGAWTNIATENQVTQSFKPGMPVLLGIDIGIVTGNRGRGGDSITLTVIRGEKVLASVSQFVQEGFDGLLHFDMPGPVDVVPGEVLNIRVNDTGKIVFGWKYGGDTYKDGDGSFYGKPHSDFSFQTYGRM